MATDNLARGIAASKLSKKGGTIDGNLAITGDLNVAGTTVTTRQETLFIKDNMIVTNADGRVLQGASGIAIRSGSSVVYGLVYEPTQDTVMFGQGSLDSENNFTFNTDEGLPIAIRADSSLFVDGHFVKWDATQYCFVDGGSVADIPNQKPFKERWTTTSFTALIADVYADTTVVAGDVYIGTVSGGIAGGMPFNGNAEVRIEVNTANRGVLHCEVTSSNVEPYHWECQVVSGVIYSWRSWVLTKPDGTNDLISNNKINNTYLDTDSSPTEDSTKPVQSGGVYTALSDKLGTSGDGSSTTVAFTEAQERTNVATGETQATLWGKIKKWFSDLKTVAFTGSYSDLSGKPTIPTALNDLTTDLTASKALVSDANGKVSASSVTSTELGYVSGVTSAIQTQLNGKLGTSGDGSSTTVTFTDAQTRTNVATGETQATLWGKVKKWFADLGTAAFKNVPVSGDASTTEVVMGDDTRLTNARNAADVYSWAKAATKPTYSYSEITDTPTIGNGQLKLQKNGSEIGGFYANTSYDNTIDIKSYDLRDYMRFGTDGIYWNLWASTDAIDDFLSTLTLDPDAQVAACIVRFNNGVGIYSVPLANMGGTGYAIAIVDETTFTPQVLLYVSVADTTNTNILLQQFGLTATDDGWQVSDQLVALGHTFLGSTTMSILAGGVMPNDRGANKMHRVDAFFGSSNAQWQSLDALYGVVLGDVNTQLTALNSGAGV